MGQERFDLRYSVDARLVTTPPTASFLDGGLGKTRYGTKPRAVQAKLAQVVFVPTWHALTTLDVRAQLNVDAERDLGRRIDLVEAETRFRPALTDRLGLDVRAGLFFPRISLENTDTGWLSPYTVSFSAINSWIAEEVRSLGIEGGPTLRLDDTGTELRVSGSVTRRNDPAGTLLAWRGFAFHDRVTAAHDRVPLPPLRSFARPDLFPGQALYSQPLREVDSRWTWSASASLTSPKYRVRALYQPETADKTAFDGSQYAWKTGFLAVGGARNVGPAEFILQGIKGRTRMGRTPESQPAVDARFAALFGLATVALRDHRVTLRYDAFDVDDKDRAALTDPNDESGSAWTFAYSVGLSSHVRVFAELLRVTSSRTNRADLKERPRQIETLGTLNLRLSR